MLMMWRRDPMLDLLAMFFLGILFSSCCWAGIWLSSMDRKEDEHLQEMEKWYKDAYEEDDQC